MIRFHSILGRMSEGHQKKDERGEAIALHLNQRNKHERSQNIHYLFETIDTTAHHHITNTQYIIRSLCSDCNRITKEERKTLNQNNTISTSVNDERL